MPHNVAGSPLECAWRASLCSGHARADARQTLLRARQLYWGWTTFLPGVCGGLRGRSKIFWNMYKTVHTWEAGTLRPSSTYSGFGRIVITLMASARKLQRPGLGNPGVLELRQVELANRR